MAVGCKAGWLGAVALLVLPAWAGQAQVAVAANFAEPIKAVAALLQQTTGHTLQVTLGATGKLYAQIQNGAPFDVLLAADAATPLRLEQGGLAVPGSRFTYALGRLVLWSARPARVDDQGAVLRAPDLGKVALANPKLSPFGAATVQAVQRLGLAPVLQTRWVQGESIGQTFAFVHTGNADVGFVAWSQVARGGRLLSGSAWVLPQALYDPIRQDAVLLKPGQGNAAALALLALLRSPRGQDLIRAHGYDV